MTHAFQIVREELLRNLSNSEGGDARRLFHGRGGCFPNFEHLNIDFYPPVLVFQLFKEEPLVDELIQAVVPEFSDAPCVLVQDRYLPKSPWRLVSGALPSENLAWEDNLCYQLTFMKNQNVGFFLDMLLGRRLVRELAEGKRVLNLFSYTCSLSVAAMAGGAETVLNMDMSKAALRVGRENHVRNKQDTHGLRFLPYDILKSFGNIKRFGPYDLVIIDPPTRQRGAFQAEKDYDKIVRRLPQFLAPGASILACLNAPGLKSTFLEELFAPEQFQLVQRLGRPDAFPEKHGDASLKILHYQYKGAP